MPKPHTTTELCRFYNDDDTTEIGIDEAGRGPLFGRVYTAAVVLPKDDSFDHSMMKDSKKFHSTRKINEAADYIKANARFWSVTWSDETTIDSINIRQATLKSMHSAIRKIRDQDKSGKTLLLVDGNDFKAYSVFDDEQQCQVQIPHICIEGGDNKYSTIAAASILAKTERDKYISELCDKFPALNSIYSIGSNKGYGTAKHLEAIRNSGITPWHRRSYGICKTAETNDGIEN